MRFSTAVRSARRLRRSFYAPSATFGELGLPSSVEAALRSAGLDRPTAVQEQAIPVLRRLGGARADGEDQVAIVVAETGSGKTVAYLAPVVAALVGAPGADLDRRTWRGLVLCPNIALCEQVRDAARSLFGSDALDVTVLTGNSPPRAEPTEKGARPVPQIAIATPAGLVNHVETFFDERLEREFVRSLAHVVFDEADMLLTGGFDAPVRKIVSLLAHGVTTRKGEQQFARKELAKYMGRVLSHRPSEARARTPLTFVGATMPTHAVKSAGSVLDAVFPDAFWVRGARAHMGDPAVDHVWLNVESAEEKIERVVDAVRSRAPDADAGADAGAATLVFCNSVASAVETLDALRARGVHAVAHHRDVDHDERMEQLRSIRAGGVDAPDVLVCTDAAARGIDLPSVGHVVQADFATCAVDFVHRIGRTGRGGRTGRVTNLWSRNERDLVDFVRRALTENAPIEEAFSRRRSFKQRIKREAKVRVLQSERGEGSAEQRASERGRWAERDEDLQRY
jgi:superfamily II DNA/RNA helicase